MELDLGFTIDEQFEIIRRLDECKLLNVEYKKMISNSPYRLFKINYKLLYEILNYDLKNEDAAKKLLRQMTVKSKIEEKEKWRKNISFCINIFEYHKLAKSQTDRVTYRDFVTKLTISRFPEDREDLADNFQFFVDKAAAFFEYMGFDMEEIFLYFKNTQQPDIIGIINELCGENLLFQELLEEKGLKSNPFDEGIINERQFQLLYYRLYPNGLSMLN